MKTDGLKHIPKFDKYVCVLLSYICSVNDSDGST